MSTGFGNVKVTGDLRDRVMSGVDGERRQMELAGGVHVGSKEVRKSNLHYFF